MSCFACGQSSSRGQDNIRKDQMAFNAMGVLKEIRLFKNMTSDGLRALNAGLVERTFPAGGYLMRQGEDGDEFFIIVSGKCEVFASNGEAVAQLKEGDYCGEQSLITAETRNASIRAVGSVVTLVCDKKTFDDTIEKNVSFVKREAKRKAVLTSVPQGMQHGPAPTAKSQQQRSWLFEKVDDNVMFMHLSEEQRYLVIDQMYEEDIPQDTDLIVQGDTNAQTFYVVEQGEFDIFVNGEHVSTIPRGGCFGELALMYKAPRAATVRAAKPAKVWTVRRNAFRAALANHAKNKLNQNLEFLKNIDFLSPLLNDELAHLDEALEEKRYSEGDVIIRQGADPNKFYIIKRGTANWTKAKEDGDSESGQLEAGQFFGELALINDDKRAATVGAATDLTLLELSRAQFEELLGPLDDMMHRRAESVYSPRNRMMQEVCGLEELRSIGILGKGAFGLVSLVVDPNTGKSYALKAIKKAQIVELGQQSHIINEKNVMEMMTCDFLVNLRGTYKDMYRVYFLLDVCLGGELFTILRRRRYFNEPTSKFYAACVVEAFDYMHGQRIIYRDLKPENLVLDSQGFLKVTDFGFAKVVKDKTFTLCGTPDYLAPEIVTGQGHGKGVDWWTLGILIYEMLASFPPFFDDEPIETYRKIIKCRIKFPRYFTTEAKELIKSLLRAKATKRLGVIKGGAKNIRAHPWFNGFDWDGLTGFTLTPPIVPTVRGADDISNFDQAEDDHEDLVAVDPSEDFDADF